MLINYLIRPLKIQNSALVLVSMLLAFVSASLVVSDVTAQDMSSVTKARKVFPVKISTGGYYQQRTHAGTELSQISIPVSVQMQITPALDLGINISQATAQVDQLADIQGISDVHLSARYSKKLERMYVVPSIGVSIPVGTNEFSSAEYVTAERISLNQYDFRVPVFGQGASIAPGISLVVPLNQSWIASVGVTLRFRDAFKPVEGLADNYNWGDERLFTVGLHGRLVETIAVMLDAGYLTFESDKIGETSVVRSGNHLWGEVKINKSMGGAHLWLIARYRDIDTRRVFVNPANSTGMREFPGSYYFSAQYHFRVGQSIQSGLILDWVQYEEANGFMAQEMYGAGVEVKIALSPAIIIPLYGKVQMGDIEGFEAGLGLVGVF